MKITGIEIGEYRQFKNIKKFDFTYPANHPTKAGQPLDKVCFIGQSGTGKTTLLKIIEEYFKTIDFGLSRQKIITDRDAAKIQRHRDDSGMFFYEYIQNIKIEALLNNKTIVFDRYENSYTTERGDRVLAWLNEENLYNLLQEDRSRCLFIKDSIAQDADAFLVDQEKASQSFSDFIKTDTEIEQEREKKEERIKAAGLNRVVSLGERKSMDIWWYLLKEVFEYDETGKTFARNIVHEADSSSINSVIDKLVHWKKHSPNPRIDLANTCLNPLLKHFFLEIDTEGDKVPIVIKTKQGLKIDSTYLSAGTRQLLATAIPIYKFDTKDTVILFDEPERSLFPDIQRELVKYYTSLAPEAQFFFATHSPIIASAFEPCERFILFFNENGEVDYHTGIAPEGDDPNDILRQDFAMAELMLQKGIDEYERYRQLAMQIRAETDEEKKNQLIIERLELGNRYNFAGQYAQSK